MTYIGIDPGLNGCLVAIDENKKIISWADVDCSGERINIQSAANWFSQFDRDNTIVAVENPHIHGGDGIKTLFAAFRYGYSLGTLQTLPIILGYNTELIAPMTWKSHFGLTDSSISYLDKKEKSVNLAININEDQEDIFVTIKKQGKTFRTIYNHDRAEAYLIACFMFDKDCEVVK